MSSKPIRVLVVDDHALVREGVRALITSLPDLEFAGEAADGQQAIERARETRPDVVLMDLHMPVLDGGRQLGQRVDFDGDVEPGGACELRDLVA